MAKRYLLNKKILKNQNLDLRCCAVNCCMEILWRSRWKTVLKLPLSDAKPVFILPALYVSSCSDQVWRSCWEHCWCCLSPVDAEPVSSVFSGLFFFFFLLSVFASSKPVTFVFLRILPIFSLLCTTWNFAKFHTFLSVFLSLHSCCPLIRSDEALWRNVIFSIKKFI